jgi:hypothetical protein
MRVLLRIDLVCSVQYSPGYYFSCDAMLLADGRWMADHHCQSEFLETDYLFDSNTCVEFLEQHRSQILRILRNLERPKIL